MKLTPEQASALADYREQAGRKWKERLMADWMRGGSDTYRGEWAYLQQIRHTLGSKIFFEELNDED